MGITEDNKSAPSYRNSIKHLKTLMDCGTIHIQGKNFRTNIKDHLSVTVKIVMMEPARESKSSRVHTKKRQIFFLTD